MPVCAGVTAVPGGGASEAWGSSSGWDKVAASAALAANRSYEAIEEEVQRVLAEAKAVVSEDRIIMAVGVTQEANGVQQLKPMWERLEQTLEAAGIEERPRVLLGDAGYWSEANVWSCTCPDGSELLIATAKSLP